MSIRIVSVIFTFLSIVLLPYWLYFIALLAGIILFPFFWEGIILAYVIDLIHGTSIETTIITLVLLILLLPIRENIRSYV